MGQGNTRATDESTGQHGFTETTPETIVLSMDSMPKSDHQYLHIYVLVTPCNHALYCSNIVVLWNDNWILYLAMLSLVPMCLSVSNCSSSIGSNAQPNHIRHSHIIVGKWLHSPTVVVSDNILWTLSPRAFSESILLPLDLKPRPPL